MHRHETIDEQLAAIELFRGRSTKQLRRITSLTTRVVLPPGKVLTREGRPGGQFTILLDGTAAVSACDRVVATRGPGDFLGEISLLGARVQTATVFTTTPVVAAVAAKRDFWSLLGDMPELRDVLQDSMRARLDQIHAVAPDSAYA